MRKLIVSIHFETVDTILMGHGTYEDLSTKWPYAKAADRRTT